MWVARDENGYIDIFDIEPHKSEKMKMWLVSDIETKFMELPKDAFPTVKWEDEKPTKVMMTIEIMEE